MHDPGGKSLFQIPPGTYGEAYISDDQKHRIWLSRIWGPGARYILFIGMNPSTARADMDDPTVRRETGFSQRWEFDGYFKGNVATYRATNPKSLLEPNLILSHEDNIHCMKKLSGRCSKVVIAYGSIHPILQPLAITLVEEIRKIKKELWCFGRTQQGFPKHPLYLKSDTPLVIYE